MDSGFLRLARRVQEAEAAAEGCLSKNGGVMTGGLTAPCLILDVSEAAADAAGNANGVWYRTDGLNKWGVVCSADDNAASGNAGADFAVWRYDDNGNLIDAPFSINRASGKAAFAHTPQVGTGFIWHQENMPIEQGVWTPRIIGTTNWASAATSQASGKYVRVGNMIHIFGRVQISSKNGMTGNVAVCDLPMVCRLHSAGTVGLASGVTNNPLLALHIDSGSNIAYVIAGAQHIIQAADISDAFALWSFRISYAVA